MNRYRTIPGTGPPKASATTTCQKCLQKDSYECKANLQERPYASRPSRTQQFRNPKLAPRLNSENPNELLASKGVADEMLAKAAATRGSPTRRSKSPDRMVESPRRERSRSASSADSVSTISTNRSRSRSNSPFRRRLSRGESSEQRPRRYSSRSMSKARGRKRQRRSVSSSSRSTSRPRQPGSHRKNRRYRSSTPEDRGRPESKRRGSHRQSGSPSVDKSRVTKTRRSMDQNDEPIEGGRRDRADDGGGHKQYQRRDQETGARRRERSLSPYSKRIALTQSMNMDR